MTVDAQEPRLVPRRSRRNAGAPPPPPAVHWHEGMLLAPQHFQSASLRNEVLAYYHTSAVSPFHWGLMELDSKFSEGVVSVQRVEAVMPDGLLVRYPDGGAAAYQGAAGLALDLNKRIEDVKKGKRTVYLAVASNHDGRQLSQRYEIGAKERVPDDTNGVDVLELGIRRPRLQLVLEDELPSSWSGFPLMNVEWKDGLKEDDTFEPPWLRVASPSTLYKLCRSVAGRLRETAMSLARRLDPASESARGRLLIHGIVANLPAFEVLLASEAAHPFPLYLSLASLLGSLSVGAVPPQLDAYDHDNVLPAFRRAETLIEATLRSAVKAGYEKEPFLLRLDEFTLDVKKEWLDRELVLGITIGDRTLEQVHEWIMGAAIGARSRIDSLLKRRVTGLMRRRLREHELIPTDGVVFYLIEKPYVDLPAAGELVIASSGQGEERRPEEIVLYVKTED